MKVLNRNCLLSILRTRTDEKVKTLEKVAEVAKEIKVCGDYCVALMGNNVYTINDKDFAISVESLLEPLDPKYIVEMN